jgi:chromosome segregation ATPase
MTVELEEFTQWRDSVEARLGTLEATTEREARLRATMDEDISGLHVTRDMLQALHDTQTDHTKRLRNIEGRLGNIEGRLGNVEGRLGNVEGRLGNVEEALGTVKAGIAIIQDKLDLLIEDKKPS